MSLPKWWSILLMTLTLAIGTIASEESDKIISHIVQENSGKTPAGGVRHVRAAIEDDQSLANADDTEGSTWTSDEETSSGSMVSAIVPLALLKNIVPPEILRSLRPVTSRTLVENSAKWFLPPSFNLYPSGFPRHARAENFIRFGRSQNSGAGFIGTNNKKNNFIRLGRENPRQTNFIRLGRSTSADAYKQDYPSGKTVGGFYPSSSTSGIDSGVQKMKGAPEVYEQESQHRMG